MSTEAIEVAEDALNTKLDALKIVEEKSAVEEKKETGTEETVKKTRKILTDEERKLLWEEDLKQKKLIESGVKGTVKWYSVLGHYGFIARSDEKGDIFVHQSGIAVSKTLKCLHRTLANGEEVEFDVVEGKNGLEAANVSGPERAPVKGNKYYRLLIHRSKFNNHRRQARKNSEKNEESGDQKEGEEKQERPKNRKKPRQRKAPSERAAETGQGDQGEHPKEVKERTRRNSNRKNQKREKKISDGESANPQNEDGAARRRAGSESPQRITTERCASALDGQGDAGLGAQAIDAQI